MIDATIRTAHETTYYQACGYVQGRYDMFDQNRDSGLSLERSPHTGEYGTNLGIEFADAYVTHIAAGGHTYSIQSAYARFMEGEAL